jgi:hypothetical protein
MNELNRAAVSQVSGGSNDTPGEIGCFEPENNSGE